MSAVYVIPSALRNVGSTPISFVRISVNNVILMHAMMHVRVQVSATLTHHTSHFPRKPAVCVCRHPQLSRQRFNKRRSSSIENHQIYDISIHPQRRAVQELRAFLSESASWSAPSSSAQASSFVTLHVAPGTSSNVFRKLQIA
jgi:hypothetical protein